MKSTPPILALTQGDPAGIGPEVLCKFLSRTPVTDDWRPLVVAERAAIQAVSGLATGDVVNRLVFFEPPLKRKQLDGLAAESIVVVDPIGEPRKVEPGISTAADARGAMAALDLAIDLVQMDLADAIVTLPVSKESIAMHHRSDFRGHTEYLAARAGLERYGRDYLMSFLSPDLRVALLTTHIPLKEVIADLATDHIVEALELLHRQVGGRIAVAGLNPHAGEQGLMGAEEETLIRPAVDMARHLGIDVCGPESPDSLFARARKGEFDWVLALYHDQGLIAVKTASFGSATNWTMGLPFLRTSVDHGTAFSLAGRGIADEGPLRQVVRTTLGLLAASTSK